MPPTASGGATIPDPAAASVWLSQGAGRGVGRGAELRQADTGGIQAVAWFPRADGRAGVR